MDLLSIHFLDRFPPGVLFVFSVIVMVGFIEVGYRLGIRPNHNPAKAQHSQVRAIMGAALGLTAFLLAFTFATAQTHYEVRVQGMLDETLTINSAFLQADLLPEPARSESRRLLQAFVEDRLRMEQLTDEGNIEEVLGLIQRADEIQQELWGLASSAARQSTTSMAPQNALLQSVIDLANIQTARLEASIVNRIPAVIWFTIYLTGALSMLIMGYQGGLVGRRSPLATVTLAVTFSSVLMLITDLDRPVMQFFKIDSQIVVDQARRMDETLAREEAN